MADSIIFGFEKCEAWQYSKNLAVKIYKITKDFPVSEKYGLISQINRASVSVAANIAEGSYRRTSKDKRHFYCISYGSLMEVASHFAIAFDLKYIDEVTSW